MVKLSDFDHFLVTWKNRSLLGKVPSSIGRESRHATIFSFFLYHRPYTLDNYLTSIALVFHDFLITLSCHCRVEMNPEK